MGGTASQDGNLAPLSKVSKEKPPKRKKPHQVRKTFLKHSFNVLKKFSKTF